MKPQVIPSRCMGHRICQQIAPEVFRVDDHRMAWVVDDDPPRELFPKVRQAVARCPAKALMTDDA